jgi:hypothetical protein
MNLAPGVPGTTLCHPSGDPEQASVPSQPFIAWLYYGFETFIFIQQL